MRLNQKMLKHQLVECEYTVSFHNKDVESDTHRKHTDAERGLQQTRHLSSPDSAPQSAQLSADTPPPGEAVRGFLKK